MSLLQYIIRGGLKDKMLRKRRVKESVTRVLGMDVSACDYAEQEIADMKHYAQKPNK